MTTPVTRAAGALLTAWRTARSGEGSGRETFWHQPDAMAGRLGWDTLQRALDDATIEPGMLRLVGASGRVHEQEFVAVTYRAGIPNRELVASRLSALLSEGCTLTVDGVDRISAPVRGVREMLEYAVGTRAWCNAFASCSEGSAFGEHSDGHHTLVVQGSGTKHWRVRDPASGRVVLDAVVRPGDALHVPMGWPHEVRGTGEPSLHWTFGWSGESDELTLLRDLERRERRGALDPGALDTALLGDRAVAVAEAKARRQATSTLRRVGTSLPWSLVPGSVEPEAVTVTWAARLPPLVSQTSDSLIVETLGRRLTLDLRLAPVLRQLSSGAPVPAAELVGGDVDRAGVTAFLSWGLRQDLLILHPYHDPTG